jgi:parallel beta-helix repeat protein
VCYNNTVSENSITANYDCGVRLDYSSYSRISGNNITDSNYGTFLYQSSNNAVYHNNFVNNVAQVYSETSVNLWDDGYPSGGNYWSNYTGADEKRGPNQDLIGNDGIIDTPYVIDANDQDRYPLKNPYGPPIITYSLTMTTTIGGTTNPNPGTYIFTANSAVQVMAIQEADYLFEHWELDGVNVGSSNPFTVTMDKNHVLKAVFSLVLHVDVNNDGTVNLLDLILIAKAFGTFPGDPNYNSSADINRDGRINILDLILVATHLGQHGL